MAESLFQEEAGSGWAIELQGGLGGSSYHYSIRWVTVEMCNLKASESKPETLSPLPNTF